MSLCNPAADCQPKPYSPFGAATRLVNLIEAVEDKRDGILKYTNSRVLDPQLSLIAHRVATNNHVTASRRIFDRVVEKLSKNCSMRSSSARMVMLLPDITWSSTSF